MSPPEIVIADDDKAILGLMAKALEAEGYAVRKVLDGDSALTEIRARRPAALVLDLEMPVKDGWEVCKELRADPLFARLPIIMVTAAYGTVEDAIAGRAAGADFFLRKPFDMVQLAATVRRACARTEAN